MASSPGIKISLETPSIPALSAITVDFTFSGAITHNSATVKARLSSGSQARLVVSRHSNFSTYIYYDAVTAGTDGVVTLVATGLKPNTQYYYSVVGSTAPASGFTGKFKTFPNTAVSFKVLASSCSGFNNPPDDISNHEVFAHMLSAHSDALVFFHNGDLHYRDISTNTASIFYTAYKDVMSQSNQKALYRDMPICYMPDDHDFGPDNSNRDSPSKTASLTAYKTYFPHWPLGVSGDIDVAPMGQTFVIGRVRFIVLDNRSHRSPQGDTDNSSKTILGTSQKAWLKSTLLAATEPLIGIMIGVPWIGTSVDTDGWTNYQTERAELADFFVDNNLNDKIFLFAGDMHGHGIDNGENSQYATGSSDPGPVVLQLGSLDSASSVKGGPYSEGASGGVGRFGEIQFFDDGNIIRMTVIGWQYVGTTLTKIISFTKTYS